MSQKFYIHAGYILDWSDEKVQAEISEILGPILTWTHKKKGIQKVKLKKQPIVCMCYYTDGDVKMWFDTHNRKGHMGYFKKIWFKHEENIAVLQGTITGKQVYVVIGRDASVSPISIKKRIADGSFSSVDIDLKCPVAAYAFVETRKLVGNWYFDVEKKEYISGIPYSEN